MNYVEYKSWKGGTAIKVCNEEIPHPQASFAMDVIGRLAICTAVPDGEDSVGRQKLRMMTPEEIVARATDVADRAWKEFRARGWLLDIPLPKPGKDEVLLEDSRS